MFAKYDCGVRFFKWSELIALWKQHDFTKLLNWEKLSKSFGYKFLFIKYWKKVEMLKISFSVYRK